MRTVALIVGEQRIEGVAFAKTVMRDCLAKGDVPFCFQLLNLDGLSDEEMAAVRASLKDWQAKADAVVVYDELGVSEKMQEEIDELALKGKAIESRKVLADTKGDDTMKGLR